MSLVLQRLPGDGLILDTTEGRITITMLDDCRLAIDAPASVKILRAELADNDARAARHTRRQAWRDGGRR